MGPTKFPSPKLQVKCVNAVGGNAEKHLTVGKVYTVDAIINDYTTGKGSFKTKGYSLRGVNHVWDAARFAKA